MDLLNEKQYNTPQKSTGKKVVITLLILSTIAAIGIIILMVYLGSTKEIKDTLFIFINGTQIETESNFIIEDENGKKYVAIKDLASYLGYEFDNSEYGTYSTDTTKCYIKNQKLIVGFESDTNKIYKYEEESNLDYQYYTLQNNIVIFRDDNEINETNKYKLYIALEDLPQALNCSCTISPNKEISINSMEHLAKVYQENLKESGYKVATDQNSQKLLAYGKIIVSKNDMYSVLDANLEEVIGAKYKSIYFDEYNFEFIVSNANGQYGIITYSGVIEQSLKYDGLEILDYKNMLYKVKNNNKYGIMKADGTLLTNIIYDEIGYEANPENKILYTLIIPDVEGKIGEETIVVKQNDKYGLVYLSTGETFLPCDHLEKLYSIEELGEIKYRIEAEKIEASLIEYLTKRGTIVINLS